MSSERGGLENVYRRLLLRWGGGLDGKSVTSGGDGGGLSRLMYGLESPLVWLVSPDV